MLTFVRGMAALAGPPISGLIHDTTNSYSASFYLASGRYSFKRLFPILYILPILNPCQDYRLKNENCLLNLARRARQAVLARNSFLIKKI